MRDANLPSPHAERIATTNKNDLGLSMARGILETSWIDASDNPISRKRTCALTV